MFKYLKAAFWVRQRVPLLGHVPINVLIIPMILALGLIHPAFLLIGLGFEAAFLYLLSSSPRFRTLVDLPSEREAEQQKSDQRNELIEKLSTEGRGRFLYLEKRIADTKAAYAEYNTPEHISEPNLRSLETFAWTYLKLLFARAAMVGKEGEQNCQHIRQQIEKLNSDLANRQASQSVRSSKEATLSILEKRLSHYEKRTEVLEEIDADLARIEAQVELAFDNARLQAKPEAISADVELASDTMQGVWYYGEADDTICSLDSQFQNGQLANPLAE